jgi:hypothetical protein
MVSTSRRSIPKHADTCRFTSVVSLASAFLSTYGPTTAASKLRQTTIQTRSESKSLGIPLSSLPITTARSSQVHSGVSSTCSAVATRLVRFPALLQVAIKSHVCHISTSTRRD